MKENYGKTKLLDAKDVAERLQISLRLAQRHMHDMEPIDVSGGGKQPLLRVRPEALDAWIKQHTRTAEEEKPLLRLIKSAKKRTPAPGKAYPRPVDGKIPTRKMSKEYAK